MGELLAFDVSVALMRLRLIERALHDRGGWEMEYAGVRVPVSQFTRADRVSLVGHFPPVCPMSDDPGLAVCLYHRGEMVHVAALEQPLSEDGCQVWIDLALDSSVPVPG